MPSSLPFTSVVSYHTDPCTCGVARFSQQLAERLGVPCVGLSGDAGRFPLYSLKWSEVPRGSSVSVRTPYGLFWHDAGTWTLTDSAAVVFYADPSLGPNGLWCPSLIHPRRQPKRVRLFSMGMAHKLQPQYYARVKQLLDADAIDYHLRVSVALHEGTSLSDATQHFAALKTILGENHVTILGCLSDEAVQEELDACDAVLAFFEQGLRANNTTVHAALMAGCVVITNHDAQTPGFLRASTRDILTRERWDAIRPAYYYSWERLIDQMEQLYETVSGRQPTPHR